MNARVLGNTPPRFNQLHGLVSRLDDDARIRGMRPAGEKFTTLFQRPGKTGGVLLRAYNLVAGRSELRKAVDRALAEVAPLASESKEAADAIAAIKQQTRRGGHDLRAGSIRAHLNTLQGIAAGRSYPSILDLPGVVQSHGWQDAVRLLREAARRGQPADADAVAGHLGLAMAQALDAAGPDVRFSFTVSPGVQFKKELMAALRESGAGLDHDSAARIADGAYAQGLANMADHVSGTAMEAARDVNGRLTGAQRVSHVGAFTIAGKEYTHQKTLGEGGNAVVGLYSHVDESGKEHRLVLKFLKPGDTSKTEQQAFDEMAEESIVHRAATRAAPDGIVRFERALRLPDGRLAMVMELAPNGDLNKLSDNLHASANRDSPQAHLMRLTLAQDALRGLDDLQSKAKVSHLDLKGANLFIDANGRARVADLGLARAGDRRHMAKSFENMAWNDPLVEAAYQPILAKLNEIKGRYKAQLDPLADERNTRLPAIAVKKGASQAEKDAAAARTAERKRFDEEKIAPLKARQAAEEAQAAAGGFEISGYKADTWSIGTVLYELYAGAPPFGKEGGMMAGMLQKQSDFMAMSAKDREAFLFARPGLPAVPPEMRAIIMSMLDPDASKRMNAKDALASAVFRQAGVGGPAVRQDIIALAHAKDAGAA